MERDHVVVFICIEDRKTIAIVVVRNSTGVRFKFFVARNFSRQDISLGVVQGVKTQLVFVFSKAEEQMANARTTPPDCLIEVLADDVA